jgi:hypothetical protein
MELSLCGLGQVAPAPLLGMIRSYPEDFARRLRAGDAESAARPQIPLAAVSG